MTTVASHLHKLEADDTAPCVHGERYNDPPSEEWQTVPEMSLVVSW